ncbi:MAG: hypothetical protein DDT22_00606 [candidate division WS2 bacterium]|nr:hypothetical protein [Candidatus Lithacetigena glycinireducens]
MTEESGIKLTSKSIERGQKVHLLVKGWKITETLKNFLKGLPGMIKQNGLGQTIAFLRCKGDEYKEVAEILAKLLINKDSTSTNLLNKILNSEIKEYIYMQNEAIEYAGWIKKFALAFNITSKEEEKNDTSPS